MSGLDSRTYLAIFGYARPIVDELWAPERALASEDYHGPRKLMETFPEVCESSNFKCEPGPPGDSLFEFVNKDESQGSGIAFKQFDEFDFSKGQPGPNQFRGPKTLQGSVFFQSGYLFNPEDIAFDSTLNELGFPYAGNIQPKNLDIQQNIKEDFTIAGQCTATTVEESTILSHSCVYNLCFGVDDCITYYAGGPFAFNAIEASGLGLETFDDFITHIGFGELSKSELPTVRERELSGSSFFLTATPYERTVFSGLDTPFAPNTPSLPPPYPVTIIGGIGKFENIVGSVEVITIAGRRRERGIDLSGNITSITEDVRGAIVQQIFLSTNKNLNRIPKPSPTVL